MQKPVKTAFLEMLSEARTAVDALSSWQAVRNKFTNDPRFQAVLRLSSRQAMIWFNEFVSKQNTAVGLSWKFTARILKA